ncbi:MAG: hypothetical protein RBT69_08920 [Spirochaetia bacterium]|nr:hypothetical protein [Spirochaetia bacterium]
MKEVENTKNAIESKLSAFLSGKPIWVWMLTYLVITAVVFGVFYFIFYVLTVKIWIIILIVLIIGLTLGTVNYFNQKTPPKKE